MTDYVIPSSEISRATETDDSDPANRFVNARTVVLSAAARLLAENYPGLANEVRAARDELDRADRKPS